MTSVLVHALAPPSLLSDQESGIAALVEAALQASNFDRRHVNVSPTSGWITFLGPELRGEGSPPALVSADPSAAKAQAEGFVKRLRDSFAGRSGVVVPSTLNRVALLPSLRPLSIDCVPRPDGGWSHWLFRAQPRLPISADGTEVVDVQGTVLEVMVGNRNRILGFQLRWRPVTGERLEIDAADFSYDAGEEEESPPHGLVYYSDGDGAIQHYLSPYYLVADGDDLVLTSGCSYSLVISYGIVAKPDGGAAVTAVVDGGSGSYLFDWAMLALDDLGDGSIEGLGSGTTEERRIDDTRALTLSTVTLPPGVHNLMVNAKDRETGAFKHHQQFVYCLPATDPGASGVPVVA